MCERQQNRSECHGGFVGSSLFVEREFEVRKPWQALRGTENAQARDDRARGKRRNVEAGKRGRAYTSKAGASIDDLQSEIAVLQCVERRLTRYGPYAIKGQRQRRARKEVERVGRG